MSILFHWSNKVKIDTAIKSQNQRNVEETIKDTDWPENCPHDIHVFYDSTDALCHTLKGRISCGDEEIATFTCSPDGATMRAS